MSETPLDLTEVDFGDDTSTPTSDRLKQLTDLVLELDVAEAQVAVAEQELREKKSRLQGIVEHTLPELMLELNQPILHTTDGREIKITEIVRASLPAGNRSAGFTWLIKNGHAGMVKRTIEVAFAAVEGEKAEKLLTTMEGSYGANARQIMKVEPASLTAFIKRQLKEGASLPRDVFDIREFVHAKVSKKK